MTVSISYSFSEFDLWILQHSKKASSFSFSINTSIFKNSCSVLQSARKRNKISSPSSPVLSLMLHVTLKIAGFSFKRSIHFFASIFSRSAIIS